ncbi:hypothetical protein CXG46_08510 [Nocardioides alpinus]|uniref:Uncharacterized protein n=1 Tax=Nocardioides alpinus TaxID=748909 RepID=A0ABX4QYG9_9ACTN|nr:hypothetical protein CXG46_08510 [Nocardioides alpinus]
MTVRLPSALSTDVHGPLGTVSKRALPGPQSSMTGTVGAVTWVTMQSSLNSTTGMLPELFAVVLLLHLAPSVSVRGEPGLVVTVSVKVLVCRAPSWVPTATTPRLEDVIVSVICSLLTTVHVTAQPPLDAHATLPEMVLWWALAAPAMPTTAKPTATTSVSTRLIARGTRRWPAFSPRRLELVPWVSEGSDGRACGADVMVQLLPRLPGQTLRLPRVND